MYLASKIRDVAWYGMCGNIGISYNEPNFSCANTYGVNNYGRNVKPATLVVLLKTPVGDLWIIIYLIKN